MGRLLGQALAEDGLTQAEFSRMVGCSPKHINRVVNGVSPASPAQLDYWAYTLGRVWDVSLAASDD